MHRSDKHKYKPVQFCPKGHDTFVVGRNYFNKCNECFKDILICPVTQRAVTYAYSKLKCRCTVCVKWSRDLDNSPERKKKRHERGVWQRRENKYGLTRERYLELLKEQAGKCAICLTPDNFGKSLFVDHNHITDVVRGLLCNNCNSGLGYFKDLPVLLKRAAKYLRDRDIE